MTDIYNYTYNNTYKDLFQKYKTKIYMYLINRDDHYIESYNKMEEKYDILLQRYMFCANSVQLKKIVKCLQEVEKVYIPEAIDIETLLLIGRDIPYFNNITCKNVMCHILNMRNCINVALKYATTNNMSTFKKKKS